MRIAIIGPVPPSKGGIAQHTGNVVDAFRTRGHEVLLVSWRSQYPALLYKGSETDVGSATDGQHRILTWWNVASWLRARRLIKRFSPDLVWSPWVTPFHAVPGRVIMARAAARRVIHVHNAEPHEAMPFSDRLTRIGLRHADAFVVHSSTISADLRNLSLRQRSRVVPLPPNIAVTASAPPPSPPFRLLFLGFVRPYKGLDLALEALEALPSDVELTIAGEFWEPVGPWLDRIDAMGLADRVEVRAHYQTDAEVSALLSDHHVLVCPYRSATQSALVPLALAAGRPAVATRVGGLEESITSGTNGILCEVNRESLVTAITQAREDYQSLAAGTLASQVSWMDYASQVERLVELATGGS